MPLDPFGVMKSGPRTVFGLLLGALVVVLVVMAVTGRPPRAADPDDGEPTPAEAAESTNPRILPILAVYVGCYATVLIVARTLTDASTRSSSVAASSCRRSHNKEQLPEVQ